jgi:uncharacterized membrane protein YphA (DoxX/SURF4 family)
MGWFETRFSDHLYVVFRVGIGALFFMFGVQKLFGLWGRASAEFGTLVWVAGAGEFLIGLALIVGVLTRLASVFGVIEMLVAYYVGHVPNGWNPATKRCFRKGIVLETESALHRIIFDFKSLRRASAS